MRGEYELPYIGPIAIVAGGALIVSDGVLYFHGIVDACDKKSER